MDKPNPNIPSEDKIEYEDMESGYGSKATSIKEIVLRQYSRCLTEGSKEMSLGGVKTRVINGQVFEIAVPNQIEIFVNSVEMLKISLEPNIKQEKKTVGEKIEKNNDNLNKVEEYYKKEKKGLMENYKPYNEKWINKYKNEHNTRLANIEKNYEYARVKIYREILVTMSFLLKEMNYFDEEADYG